MSVGIVAVSHSRALAEAAVELSKQMVAQNAPAIAVAAGTDDGGFGTDAMLIMQAIEEVNSGDGVVILTDLGSAILSTDVALEFLGEPDDVLVVGAPFVEGLLSAVVTAASGASLEDVASDARASLKPKVDQIGDGVEPSETPDAESHEGDADVTVSASIINPNGLHARPAAQVAHMAGGFDAVIEISYDGESVDATSTMALASLGTSGGDTVEISASGAEADKAVNELKELIESGFGEVAAPEEVVEPEEESAPEATANDTSESSNTTVDAPASSVTIGVSPGKVVAPAKRMAPPIEEPADQEFEDAEAEKAKVTDAVAAVSAELAKREENAEGPAAEILQANQAIVNDRSIVKKSGKAIDAGTSAARAVWDVLTDIASKFAAVGGLTAERVTDVNDIRARLVASIEGVPMPGVPQSDEPYVLVAGELAPADTATLDPSVCLGMVLSEGGPTSHTSIMARALGIAAVISPADAEVINEGDLVLVDGGSGSVVVNPSEYERAGALTERREISDEAFTGGSTADGHEVLIAANVGSVSDAELAADRGAQGVGLFRTEFLFLDRTEAPSVDEQVEIYAGALKAMEGEKVVFRTLDAGADKPLPFVTATHEPNPALGVRGYRTSRKFPQVLSDQLDALATAAKQIEGSDPWVMAPMISTVDEARDFYELAKKAGLEKIGVMIETPSAALQAREILDVVDFVSIGTNDLAQYTMAADREATDLAELNSFWQPAVLRLMKSVGEAGQATGKTVGVCGEAAGDPQMACVLVGMGITSLSINSAALATVGGELGSHDLDVCEAAAKAASEAESASAARSAAEAALNS